jgi:hypothetical protein
MVNDILKRQYSVDGHEDTITAIENTFPLIVLLAVATAIVLLWYRCFSFIFFTAKVQLFIFPTCFIPTVVSSDTDTLF